MSFNFPSSPAIGQTTTNSFSNVVYTWNGSTWDSTPTIYDYISVRRVNDVDIALNSTVVFNTVDQGQGNIFSTYATGTGVFQLQSNRVYELDAGLFCSNFRTTAGAQDLNGFLYFGWTDLTGTPLVGGSVNTAGAGLSNCIGSGLSGPGTQPRARILYKPTTPISIKLTVLQTSGIATFRQNSSYAVIKQIA